MGRWFEAEGLELHTDFADFTVGDTYFVVVSTPKNGFLECCFHSRVTKIVNGRDEEKSRGNVNWRDHADRVVRVDFENGVRLFPQGDIEFFHNPTFEQIKAWYD